MRRKLDHIQNPVSNNMERVSGRMMWSKVVYFIYEKYHNEDRVAQIQTVPSFSPANFGMSIEEHRVAENLKMGAGTASIFRKFGGVEALWA